MTFLRRSPFAGTRSPSRVPGGVPGPIPALARVLVPVLLGFALGACQAADTPMPDREASPGAPDERRSATDLGTLADRLAVSTLVDLTHPFDDETLVWPTSIPFSFEVTFEGYTEADYYYASRDFAGPEHGGTHLDAPIHFAEGRWTTDEIPLERLVGPGVRVDVSAETSADPNYQVQVEDLTSWEAIHGRIPDGAILLLFTDRSRHWPDAEAYMGTEQRGEEAVAELSFPGLHPATARWLVENREISAVGIDTPSIDHGPSTLFEAHRVLFAENIFAFENVANLERLPPSGSTIIALPMKLAGGTGGPLRIIAVVEP
jgi:kynurenine formamidase